MKRSESQMRDAVIVDMNDFLLEYGAKKLGNRSDLAEVIYKAAKDDPKGLDELFHDQGEARQKVYEAVGEGFISDFFATESPEEVKKQADQLTIDAIKYLGSHERQLDDWKNN